MAFRFTGLMPLQTPAGFRNAHPESLSAFVRRANLFGKLDGLLKNWNVIFGNVGHSGLAFEFGEDAVGTPALETEEPGNV